MVNQMKDKKPFYRTIVHPAGMLSFQIIIEESNLMILAEKDLREKARAVLWHHREQLKQYIEAHPEFYYSFTPLEVEKAPPIVQTMAEAAWLTNTGPMAAVAGALAEAVGHSLLQESSQVIVENGGDIFLHCLNPAVIGIYAGNSPFSLKIGIKLPGSDFSRGIATSSGTVGHSWSYGQADAVTVVCRSATLADAAATRLGNLVLASGDWSQIETELSRLPFVEAAVCIAGRKMMAWGQMELVSLED